MSDRALVADNSVHTDQYVSISSRRQAFFAGSGAIRGAGPGESADGRVGAFANMLLEAFAFIEAGNDLDACV